MIDGYSDGSDITIMNCFYQYAMKDENGNRMKDYLIIVFKDNKTGMKHHKIIYQPDYTFYKTKEDAPSYNQLFIEKDKVEPVTCKYSSLLKTIATMTGNTDFYMSNIQTGQSRENEKLHTLPEIFASDSSIEDYYRKLFGSKYTNNITKLSKAYFDIEVETRYMSGDFVQMGECPINAISFLDEGHKVIHSFLWRDKRNKLVEEFENEMLFNIFTESDIKAFIQDKIGGYKQYKRFHLDEYRIDVQFFDNEIDLLNEFYGTVYAYDPDFVMSWNGSAFDIEYIMARIRELGWEPADIMCDQTWELRQVKNYVDQKNLSNFAERGDYTFISGNPIWIDQMIQYASRRKAKIGSFSSFKLDDIGELTAGVHKLDYSHITSNIAMLPWLDYKTFVLYNIFDVIVEKCIENKCNDMEYIFAKALMNNTSYKKIHRQTVYLINRMNKEFDKMGYIIGNNVNKWNEQPDKFQGALVGDPTHLTDYSLMKINSTPIKIAETDQDFDYKSLYPSIDLENNIAPNTQIGKIIIEEQVYDNENRYGNDKYERGGEFIENLVCDNIILFAHRWFRLANFKEMLSDIDEYYKLNFAPLSSYNYLFSDYVLVDGNYVTCPVQYTPVINPFVEETTITPFRFFTPRERN